MSEEQTVEEEVSLHFRRFSEDKQDQVRALVNYATLMGLDGKDLISIGGKLNRIKERREMERNRTIADELVKSCKPVGKDSMAKGRDLRRWTYVDGVGRKWRFEDADYWTVKVTSDTGATKRFRNLDRYDIGRSSSHLWTIRQVMLSVHHGQIQLNF
jgi:hypothetical protein